MVDSVQIGILLRKSIIESWEIASSVVYAVFLQAIVVLHL